ncbi:hypothetical protein INS49_015868 [Diaporthe citri]|uniref:uncharacterized protein n=1 Tax=Diaporthe citri TaxID=83186 RepID=UPI001C7F14B4|nr:uncharacterized protein INS49_015868 [Diaporthe citri]KAG6356480.1 hypothetical protein INS49_015868 [Diaporthe citri]
MAASTRPQFVDPSVALPTIDPTCQIRLLLLSSSNEQCLVCRLKIVPIDEPPPYEALSYVWGNADELQVVTIDGNAFRVTQNLYAALKHLVLPDGAVRVLWIDAICVNQGAEQSDLAERSHQVRLMSRIFSGATGVVAYLGKPYPGLFEAMEFLTVAAGGQQSHLDRLTQSGNYNVPQVCRALISFFTQPWWGRIWTVQEPIVARKVSFQFERLEIDSDIVRRGIFNIVTSRIRAPFEFAELDPTTGESLSTAFTRMSMLSLSYTGTSLLNALGAFQNRSSGDPRDKIYSLMGLFPDSDHVVSIDYTIPAERLFQDFTLAWIHKHQDLRVLSHLHNPARRVHRDMPSFAVDWGYRPSIRSINALHNRSLIQNEAFDACTGSKAIWHLEPAGLVRANGFTFDSIEAVGARHVLEFGGSWATRFKTFQGIVDMASKRGGNDRQGQEQALAAVLRTLCMDCKQVAGVYSRLRGEDDERMLKAWWGNAFKPTAPSQADRLAGEGHPIETTVWIASLERSFVFTDGGHMGLAPDWCRDGDAIAILGGGAVPMVLRPVGEVAAQGGDTPVFEVVGEAYVHGVMDGQAFRAKGGSESDFGDICLV